MNKVTKVVTFPGTLSCPKNTSPLVLGAQGQPGLDGKDGAQGPAGPQGPAGQSAPQSSSAPSSNPTSSSSTSSGVSQCNISLTSSLPWAYNRWALIGITWGVDSTGYPYGIAQVRNDTTMAWSDSYSMVQFILSIATTNGGATMTGWWFGSSTVTDEVNPLGGPWQIGQTRQIKFKSNSFFNCATSNVGSTGFRVTV